MSLAVNYENIFLFIPSICDSGKKVIITKFGSMSDDFIYF